MENIEKNQQTEKHIEGKKIINNKTFLVACLVLAGCGDNSSQQEITDVHPDAGMPEASRIAFDPGAGVLPVPNDLLFAGTLDGTLEAPGEAEARAAGSVNLGDPGLALGALDGWSTMFPLQISVDMIDNATIDASTVNDSTVFMIEAITPPSDGSMGSCQLAGVSVGSPCGVAATLTYGVDFIAVAGENSITVAPLHPLKSSTTYVVGIAPWNY